MQSSTTLISSISGKSRKLGKQSIYKKVDQRLFKKFLKNVFQSIKLAIALFSYCSYVFLISNTTNEFVGPRKEIFYLLYVVCLADIAAYLWINLSFNERYKVHLWFSKVFP